MLSLRKERSAVEELREWVTRVSVTPSVLNLPADVRCRVKLGKATIKEVDVEQSDRISPRAAARAVVRSAGVGLRGASAFDMAKSLEPKRRTLTRRACTAASTPQGPPLFCTSPKLRSRCVLNMKAWPIQPGENWWLCSPGSPNISSFMCRAVSMLIGLPACIRGLIPLLGRSMQPPVSRSSSSASSTSLVFLGSSFFESLPSSNSSFLPLLVSGRLVSQFPRLKVFMVLRLGPWPERGGIGLCRSLRSGAWGRPKKRSPVVSPSLGILLVGTWPMRL